MKLKGVLNFVWSLILSYYGWDFSMVFYIVSSCMYLVFVYTFPELKAQAQKIIS